MNNKGFTLVEILAVIAIIAVLSIIVLPNVVNYYKTGTTRAMQLQESQALDGAKLFIEDFCRNPISNAHKDLCRSYEKTITGGKVFFCLSSLQESISIPGYSADPYLKQVTYKNGTPCTGIIIFDKNLRSYDNGKTYLVCRSDGATENDYATEGYMSYSVPLAICGATIP